MTEIGSTRVYQIDDTAKRIWDPNTPIVLSVGEFDTSYYDEGVNWFEGKVKLLTTGETLTTSGNSVLLEKVGALYGFSINLSIGSAESTEIGDTWKKTIALGKSVTVNLSRYRFDTKFDGLGSDEWVLLKMYEVGDEIYGGSGYWCKTLRSSLGLTKALNAIDTEALTFEVTSEPSYFS